MLQIFSNTQISLLQIYPFQSHCLWKEIGRDNWWEIENFGSLSAIFPKVMERDGCWNLHLFLNSAFLHPVQNLFFEAFDSSSFLFSLTKKLAVQPLLISLSALTWQLYPWLPSVGLMSWPRSQLKLARHSTSEPRVEEKLK